MRFKSRWSAIFWWLTAVVFVVGFSVLVQDIDSIDELGTVLFGIVLYNMLRDTIVSGREARRRYRGQRVSREF